MAVKIEFMVFWIVV